MNDNFIQAVIRIFPDQNNVVSIVGFITVKHAGIRALS